MFHQVPTPNSLKITDVLTLEGSKYNQFSRLKIQRFWNKEELFNTLPLVLSWVSDAHG